MNMIVNQDVHKLVKKKYKKPKKLKKISCIRKKKRSLKVIFGKSWQKEGMSGNLEKWLLILTIKPL